ncbi:MAG: hypothetical protein Q7K39_04335 [Candidatus Magasanikbacteria bacterium]|nr:hypothetical protein [Candidatus Magasanikbacteria bacterium]
MRKLLGMAAILIVTGMFVACGGSSGPGQGSVPGVDGGGFFPTLDMTGCPFMGLEKCPKNAHGAPNVDHCTNVLHCGACFQACPAAPPNAQPACFNAVCGFVCNPGFANCDNNPQNGCETAGFCPAPSDMSPPPDVGGGDGG